MRMANDQPCKAMRPSSKDLIAQTNQMSNAPKPFIFSLRSLQKEDWKQH